VDDTNERRRQLVDLSPDGILITHDLRVVFANAAAACLFGASSPDHLLNRSLLDRLHAGSRAPLREQLGRLRLGRTLAPTDERIVRLDGEELSVEITAGPLDDRDVPDIQIVLRDASERKRAERALRESEERHMLALAGAQEGLWDWNLETGFVAYSARWKEMLGYSGDEIEPHVRAWERLLHSDDLPRANHVYETVARGGQSYEGEFRLRHKNGHYVHVLSRGFPVRREPGGPVIRIVGTHFDLTELRHAEAMLRESEERLTLAFAGAQEGVWDWNLETGAVVYSPRWTQMLGYEVDEVEPHISAWERLLHPDDIDRAREVNDSVTIGGARTYEGEFRLRHKQGHYVHVLSRGFPVRREPGGPIVRIVGTHFDLTERKRAEDALRRAHDELEARVRERTAELARANESLRAEMDERQRSERARTELLARLVFAQEDERRRIAREMHDQFGEQLTALGRGIERVATAAAGSPALTEPVRALSKIAQQIDRDVDHLVWELRPTALDDLGLRAALANYVQDWCTRVNVTAELHTSGLLDDRLACDVETTLYRIAQEALTNVAKHACAKRVEIILERRADHVILIVEDDGVGFDQSREPGTAGQGFGLLGMQERAALVGATLEIESAQGRGTTILVRMATTSPATVDHA
jgi:PAS domain S-box-containing protein